MLKIGKFNELEVVKIVDFGLYLDGGDGNRILLPARYINTPPHIGDKMNVFIYRDSEQRLIATTEQPLIQVDEFAFLQVTQVNRVGAFLDWGLMKNLLVPFREQKTEMEQGRRYLVYAYLDNTTQRIVASAKIEKFIGNKIAKYRKGEQVEALIYQRTDIGYKVIVDNLFYGMIYHNETFRPIRIGDKVTAYVKHVREDNKVDITLSGYIEDRIQALAQTLLEHINTNGGQTDLCDSSAPEKIKSVLSCSKKDFKKAVGYLLKNGEISITESGITLKKQ